MLSDVCDENNLSTIGHALHGTTKKLVFLDYLKVSFVLVNIL
jgi:hypothetical protein